MTTISPALLDQYQLDDTPTRQVTKELGQDDFLELMMAQLKHQDPMEPMDNGEFLGQMAQFSTVSGIEDMATAMDELSQSYATGQTLQATQLVGQQVLIEDNTVELNEKEGTSGVFELSRSSNDVKLEISNSTGAVVKQVELGPFTAGRHEFTWNGEDSQGVRLPPGQYNAAVSYRNGENYQAATIMTSRDIESVEFGNGGQTTLNTPRGESLTLTDVRQIRQKSSTSE